MKKWDKFREIFYDYVGENMDTLKISYISEADVTLFDVRLSESEIIIYTDCLKYVLTHLTDNEIYKETEYSSKQELSHYLNDLKDLINSMEHKKYLPVRYKNI
ncbi:hypothetical protein [Proteus hauseri]|uniref:hypothetical protein n=1 Tax=Proteus hauseri TaxID=183417 RepID=UPI0032DBA321